MCWFFVVIKLLMLKILLAGLTGLAMASRYEFGYHPSAEEFDNLLRETRRTWTHNLLKSDRDRDLFKQQSQHHQQQPQHQQQQQRTEGHYFVPKFNYENEQMKYNTFLQNPYKNAFIKHHHDLQSSSSSLPSPSPSLADNNKLSMQNVGSSLDFTFFDNEIPKPFFNSYTDNMESDRKQTFATTTTTSLSSALPEINLKPIAKPDVLVTTTTNKYSVNNLYKNNTQAHFPIYFTNPATGIVYAITEVGKSQQNVSRTNGSIPIFITKEQYERDVLLLKQEYANNCQQNHKKYSITSFSRPTTTSTTSRPQIIRLQKPFASPSIAITSSNFSPPQKKPLPVTVQTELIVKDKRPTITVRPLRKNKNKTKNRKKLKKSKPPGRKPTLTTTIRPVLAPQSQGPKIFRGSGSRTTTQKPLVNNEKLSTQLEKPNFESTIFSSGSPSIQTTDFNAAPALNPNLYFNNNRINKRSTKTIGTENWFNTDFNTDSSKSFNSTTLSRSTNFLINNLPQNLTNFTLQNTTNIPKEPIFINKTTMLPTILFNLTNLEKSRTGNLKNQKSPRLRKRSVNNFRPPQFIKKSQNSTMENITTKRLVKSAIFNDSLAVKLNSTKSLDPINSLSANIQTTNMENEIELKNSKISNKTISRITAMGRQKKFPNSRNRTHILRKRKRSHKNPLSNLQLMNETTTQTKNIDSTTPRSIKGNLNKLANKIAPNKGKKKYHKEDAEYDVFDFVDDDDDDDYESDETEEEEDGEEEYEDDDDENKQDKYQAQHSPFLTSETGLSVEELKEKNTHENGSSAEEEADFGAIEEEQFDYHKPNLDYEEPTVGANTKTTNSKKRIRRRPEQLKAEDDDYDDNDENDENSISANLGGFFRMIFYPVQVVMGSVMDTFMSKDSEDDPVNPYTQYTSYHNKLKEHASDEYYDDYDSTELSSSSLSSWLTALFGFNRRNKKIGSTTAAPVASKPTESSSWLPSWFGFGVNDRISTESASAEDNSDYDKWFASWFGETKPKARKRTTTTTSTTTQLPQVPILTIVDPMRNPQNWIGILAHHILNQTASTTQNPLRDIWAKVTTTTTTTENPEIPRKIKYDKYQIWRLKPQDDTQVRALEEYKKSEDGIKLQWLKGPSLRGLTDVLVPPKMLVDFQGSLTFELIDHEVLIFDVGKAIAYEKTKEDYYFTTTQKPKRHQTKHPTPSTMSWHKYYEYDDIVQYLETMRMRFPQLVELMHIGRSFEGRPLIVMKIESKQAAAVNSAQYGGHQKTKLRNKKRIGLANAVFIEAGTHGMEWIGPATATWIINELLKIMKKNSTDDQSFIRNTTWYIMPVLNPDGYVYSHEFDRFWKKSRSRHVSRPTGIINSAMTWLQKKRAREKVCFGVDLDRNWHYQWGRRGSSKSPCNELYAGPVAFSEPETKAISDFLMDYRTQIKLFISMQAYGQIISYPYKANTTYDSERLDDLFDVAMVGTDGLRKQGSKSRYKIDSSNDLVEHRSGCADAFAAYEAGIPFSYTIQLADNGVHGYLLPSASIESTAKDSFQIITGMLDYI